MGKVEVYGVLVLKVGFTWELEEPWILSPTPPPRTTESETLKVEPR